MYYKRCTYDRRFSGEFYDFEIENEYERDYPNHLKSSEHFWELFD